LIVYILILTRLLFFVIQFAHKTLLKKHL